jgi:hypothetical protein
VAMLFPRGCQGEVEARGELAGDVLRDVKA